MTVPYGTLPCRSLSNSAQELKTVLALIGKGLESCGCMTIQFAIHGSLRP